MADNSIFLTPCSKQGGESRAYQHLQNTVIDGVARSKYEDYIDRDFGDRVAFWGATDGTKGTWDALTPEDYLLFYIGDETYKYAAEVLGKEENLKLANELWPDFSTTTTGGDDPHDPWQWIIFLDDPIEVEISGDEIHGFADHNINYTYRFMQLNNRGTQKINEKFGSTEAYIQQRAVTQTAEPTSSEETASTQVELANEQVDTAEAASDLATPSRVDTQVSRIIRNTELARGIKEQYNHRCQVCGTTRQRSAAQPYAEAHHIHPLGDTPPGPDVEENILVLCPNHHADFDYGLIRVNPETLTIDHSYEAETDGDTLHVHADHSLNRDYLEYHNQEKSNL